MFQKLYKKFSVVDQCADILICPAAAAAKSLQSCPTLCDPRDGSPPRLHRPWDSPGKNTGVGCISFSNAWKWKVKVKSLSPVRLLASDPMDCSLPGSSIHGIFQARGPEWGAMAFSLRYENVLHSLYIPHTQVHNQYIDPHTSMYTHYSHIHTQIHTQPPVGHSLHQMTLSLHYSTNMMMMEMKHEKKTHHLTTLSNGYFLSF